MARVYNGFSVMVENTDTGLVYSYYFGLNDECEAKKVFAKIVASCITKEGKNTSPAEVASLLKTGHGRVPGVENTWSIECGVWVFVFMPTLVYPSR